MSTTAAPSSAQDVSANNSPIYTLFGVETTERLTREHLTRLAVGVVGAVVIKNFSSRQDCVDVMGELENILLGGYEERLISPRIAKLGPAAYDFYGATTLNDEYWQQSDEAAQVRSTLLRGTDPMDLATGRIKEAWGGPVEPARSGGRPLFGGMIREINNGAKLHFDEITREFPGVLDRTPVSFLTINWYLSVPEAGGETSVYRRRWRPADEAHRDGYGYDEVVVADEPAATFRPEAGDAVIFDTRNLHLVRPNNGGGRRVSLSFFLGFPGDGPLHIWS
jgi:hypothetical protein